MRNRVIGSRRRGADGGVRGLLNVWCGVVVRLLKRFAVMDD